jgi:cell wall-associated NlpC family hydrolase/LysM repeat protein
MKSKFPLKVSRSFTFSSAVLCSSLLSAFLILPAHADTYHAVESGDTLASVAKTYNVSIETLRAANKLDLADSAQLGSMLLRIPGAGDQAEIKLPVRSASTPPRAASSARYFGSVTKYVSYTAQNGDTLESIAAKFSGGGQSVSALEIRTKNNVSGTPAAGSTLLIPVTTKYGTPTRSASAQIAPQVKDYSASTPSGSSTSRFASAEDGDRADMNVSVSQEMELPFARAVSTSGSPIYQAPNTQAMKAEVQSRGNILSTRGGSAAPTLNRRNANNNVDGARILQNGEELATTPSPRVQETQSPSSALARVAKIAHNGARIRRLPDAGAVTLYKCATGTELAVLKQNGAWSAILMSDRSTGWIPTHYIKFTSASVDVSTQVITDNSSDADSEWRGGYSSNHPAVVNALKWMGTRYVYGGEGRNGIDCSSLVQHAFASAGVRLPRVSRDQARVGRAVAPENLQPGDRLYFSASGTHVDHTGIYMGNGLFVHASGRARCVTVSRLADRRNWNIFVCARR